MVLQQIKSKRSIVILAAISLLIVVSLISFYSGVFQSEREKRISFSSENKIIKVKKDTVKRITMPKMPSTKKRNLTKSVLVH